MRKTMLAATAAALGALISVSPSHAQTWQPQEQVDALEGLFGKHAGFRRSGAKGLCASGYFTGNAVGRTLSSACESWLRL